MLEFLFYLFVVAFFLNLLWELWHSRAYEACQAMPLDRYVRLIVVISLKDAFWITLLYWCTVLIFQNAAIIENPSQLALFIALALTFSFIVASEERSGSLLLLRPSEDTTKGKYLATCCEFERVFELKLSPELALGSIPFIDEKISLARGRWA